MQEQDLLAPTVLGAVSRRKVLTLIVLLVFAFGGLAYSLTRPAAATASASFVVAQPTTATNGSGDPNFIANQVAIVELPSTADSAALLLKQRYPLSTLNGHDVLSAEKILNGATSNLITVQFTDPDPTLARAGANSLVAAYMTLLANTASTNLQQQTTRLDDEIASLLRALVGAGGPTTVQGTALAASRSALIATRSQLVASGGNSPTITAQSLAQLPKASRSLGALAGLALGGVVGLVVAVALAYGLAQTRRKFTDRFEPELLLQRPLLSEVPEFSLEGLRSDVPSTEAPQSSAAEAFRFVSAALDTEQRVNGPLIVAITGASSTDGKTSTAANLAVTFAHRGLRTVAIDADLEGQGLGFLLLGDARHAPGLSEILAGRVSVESALRSSQTNLEPNLLSVITAGLLHGPTVTDTVSVTGVGDLLADLGARADVIIIDVPSPLQVAYSSSILKAVGRCVVVVPHGTNPQKLGDFAQRLSSLSVDAIGYVYTKAPLRRELGQLSRYVSDRSRIPAPAQGNVQAIPDGGSALGPMNMSAAADLDNQATEADALVAAPSPTESEGSLEVDAGGIAEGDDSATVIRPPAAVNLMPDATNTSPETRRQPTAVESVAPSLGDLPRELPGSHHESAALPMTSDWQREDSWVATNS